MSRRRNLHPSPRHPVLWALADLCGLGPAEIARRSGVTRARLARLEEAYPPSPDEARRLLALLSRTRDEMALAPVSSYRPAELTAHRRALYRVIQCVLEDFAPGTGASAAPLRRRETDLERDLLAAIGAGLPRDQAIAALRRAHSAASVRRCARRVGVQIELRAGLAWWLPPHPLQRVPPPAPPAVDPAPREARTPLQRRIRDAVSVALGRAGGSASGPAVVAAVQRRHPQVSRAAVYREARRMRLTRTVAGFGAAKTSTWSLPPPPPASHDPAPPRPGHSPPPATVGEIPDQCSRCGRPEHADGCVRL